MSASQSVQKYLGDSFEMRLERAHVALLLLIHERLAGGDTRTSLSLPELRSLVCHVDHLFGADADEPTARRAQAAIRALEEARVLMRADLLGHAAVVPEWRPTGIGQAICEYILAAPVSADTLAAILAAVTGTLADVAAHAEALAPEADWDAAVILRLRHVVETVTRSVQGYQAMLDEKQIRLRQEVPGIVRERSKGALESAMAMLNDMTVTMADLRRALLERVDQATLQVQRIVDAARVAGSHETAAAADATLARLEQIVAWSTERSDLWSEYYRWITGHLRLLLRVDPNREVSTALRRVLQIWPDDGPGLPLCAPESLRVLDDEVLLERSPTRTRRPRDWDAALAAASPDLDLPLQVSLLANEIVAAFEAELEERGAASFAPILRARIDVPLTLLGAAAGQALQTLLVRHVPPRSRFVRWVHVRDGAEVKEYDVSRQ
ncbi:Chromosome partition protein MukF [Methylorubrum podarium]|nr:Chromosome partition protein MukF [Methylorubrum podarium]